MECYGYVPLEIAPPIDDEHREAYAFAWNDAVGRLLRGEPAAQVHAAIRAHGLNAEHVALLERRIATLR